MRPIAILFLVLLAFATSPVAEAANDCIVDANARIVCAAAPVSSPDPRVPVASTTVYVFVDGAACSGNAAGRGCTGVVYQESNGCPGLQTGPTSACGGKPADRRVAA